MGDVHLPAGDLRPAAKGCHDRAADGYADSDHSNVRRHPERDIPGQLLLLVAVLNKGL